MYPLLLACATRAQTSPPPDPGWRTDYIGFGRGNATLSLGAQIWKDRFRFRNLVARSTIDLAPGLRAHLSARRREGSWKVQPFRPGADEAYLEGLAFYRAPEFQLAFNLKAGHVRYLRFPEPDRLALFDQVPGISDFTGEPFVDYEGKPYAGRLITDYRGAILTFEAAHRSGFGFHFGGIAWGFDSEQRGLNALEWYGFYRNSFSGGWMLEGRIGGMAARREPLGRPARSGSALFLGKRLGEFEIGAMMERRRGTPAYTGVMVGFRPTPVTRFLGKISFDYQRKPEGIAFQYDLFAWRFGETTLVPTDEELVGEVRALRLRTFWKQGFQRNEYEHRLSSWGQTGGAGRRVVVEEKPWHLQYEALTSPHKSLNREWFRDRTGPAQLAQEVTYRFYRRRQ